MPNIATALKLEIARVAKKVLRSELDALQRTSAKQRREISDLRRRLDAAEKALARASKASRQSRPTATPADAGNVRFSAKGLKAHRVRLGLSANDVGRLIGASGQSVYHWEDGKSRPRDSFLSAIAALRQMGKREAQRLLEQAHTASASE